MKREMKYLLTLEKFKSNIISKVIDLMNEDNDFKYYIKELMGNYDIKIDQITDEYFSYLPTNRVLVKPKPKKKGEEEEVKDKYFVGQRWRDVDNDTDTIKEINGDRIGAYSYSYWCHIVRYKKGDHIWTLLDPDTRGDSGETTVRFSGGSYTDSSDELLDDRNNFENADIPYLEEFIGIGSTTEKKTSGRVTVKKFAKKKFDNKIGHATGKTPHHLFFWFTVDNKLKAYTNYDSNSGGHESGEGFGYQEIEKTDFVVIFNLKKAIRDFHGVRDLKSLRKDRKEGASALLSNEKIKEMNIERFQKALINKYSHIDNIEDIENYVDYTKIIKRFFSKNPLGVILNGSSFDRLQSYKDDLNSLATSVSEENDGDYDFVGEIDNLKRSVSNILDFKFINEPVDYYFNGAGGEDDRNYYGSEDEYLRYLKIFREKFSPKLSEIELILRNKIESHEFNSLIDLDFFILKLEQIRNLTSRGRYELSKIRDSLTNNSSVKYGFSYHFDEYLDNKQRTSKELKSLDVLKKFIETNL